MRVLLKVLGLIALGVALGFIVSLVIPRRGPGGQ